MPNKVHRVRYADSTRRQKAAQLKHNVILLNETDDDRINNYL